MKTLDLSKCNHVIFFGGGPVLRKLYWLAASKGYRADVITSSRLSKEDWEDVPYLVWDELKTSHPISSITDKTFGLSIGATWIFSKKIIDKFGGRLLNSHPSSLPLGRGGGGFSWRIMAGVRDGCCTLHQIDDGVDTGPILDQEEFYFHEPIKKPQQYFDEQHERDYLFLKKLFTPSAKYDIKTQSEDSSYWPRLNTDIHGVIDWRWSATHISRFICAFDDPYNGAWTFLGNRKVRIKDVTLFFTNDVAHPFQSGIIYNTDREGYRVSCNEGNIYIKSVTDWERNPIKPKIGDRFWTPCDELQKARGERVYYTPLGIMNVPKPDQERIYRAQCGQPT